MIIKKGLVQGLQCPIQNLFCSTSAKNLQEPPNRSGWVNEMKNQLRHNFDSQAGEDHQRGFPIRDIQEDREGLGIGGEDKNIDSPGVFHIVVVPDDHEDDNKLAKARQD